MHFYLLLVTLTLVNAGVITDTKCDGVTFDGHYHEKEILKTGLDRPNSLAVDYNTNIIYFCYNVKTSYNSALFDLNTKEFKDIDAFPFGHSPTVDQNTHDVYIVGSEGIYKYNYKNQKSELYAATDDMAYNLFIKDILYFSEYFSNIVYTYIDGERTRFEDLEDTKAREFVIDRDDVMFYANDTGFYAQKKGGKDAVMYSDQHVNGLTLDIHGNAYMCTLDAIYKINKMTMSLDKLTDVDYCRGLTFDGYNNMIYSDYNSIVRFISL